MRAECYVEMGQDKKQDAIEAYNHLLDVNPDT